MRLFRDKQGEPRVWTHYSDQRWFLHIGAHCLKLEVGRARGSRWADFRFGGGYVEGIGISAGFGYGFWLTWEMSWPLQRRIPFWPMHSEHEIGVGYSYGTARLKLGYDPMGTHWGQGKGWMPRWLRNREIKIWDNDWIIGRDKYTKISETEPRRVLIPVNEWPGDEYPYDVSLETVSWANRFRVKRRSYWDFKAVEGVGYNQHTGKGENSWDCGDDGIYGCAFEDKPEYEALPALVGAMRERILANRRRYGRPSTAPRDLVEAQR